VYSDYNTSSLLTAWILCQSGFQIRIAQNNSKIGILFASNHVIFEKSYYILDGMKYYPLRENMSDVRICNVKFKGEKPLSLSITTEQFLGSNMSEKRAIKSSKYPSFCSSSSVNKNLIDFYNSFPTSAIGSNQISRWAIYANTPFSSETKAILYPQLKEQLKNCSTLEAADKLLNLVQTGFKYEYDDKVWGHDRAFFAEETLFYPYCDCEDRSILFSRLVRDLLGLDVALVYYPGHMATAVCFNENVSGSAIVLNNRKYIICDPTFIGAPVGAQMPNLQTNKIQAINLQR
ncbi:MAG: hypothetical protein K2K88_04650, partial [Muribaculaceae bacterium]|nr:hypothetical protein [Muribaculaceae bacterium]